MDAVKQSWYEQNYFLIRRLHSLTGIVPIGVFLIAHLVTNSSLAWGKFGIRPGDGEGLNLTTGGITYFQKEVSWINTQIPHLLLIEITLWAAIIFHSVFGVLIAMQGKSNTSRYQYQANWRYSLQRISGYIGIFFIFYHVATLRWGWSWLVPGGTAWSHHYAVSTLTTALRGGEDFTAAGIAVSLFYFIGITMLIFHFANGLWTAAITWGITISAPAQRNWGYACFAIGAGLMVACWSALGAALVYDPATSRAIEQGMMKAKPEAAADKPMKNW